MFRFCGLWAAIQVSASLIRQLCGVCFLLGRVVTNPLHSVRHEGELIQTLWVKMKCMTPHIFQRFMAGYIVKQMKHLLPVLCFK